MSGVDAAASTPSAALTSAVQTAAFAGDRCDIARVGVDVVSIPRMNRLVSEGGSAFLARGWTSDECAEAAGDPKRLATRWAAKEAVMKCLGLGISDLDPRDIEIVSSESGAPSAVLRDSAADEARRLGISRFHISASHESGWAVAIAVACMGTELEDLEVSIQREDGS
ncbi:MAG: holo-ACP synthase [Acidimicrobiaceae bacterium]|nr:holo-ACP synthase [Acidimicrobiaceae bacterium]